VGQPGARAPRRRRRVDEPLLELGTVDQEKKVPDGYAVVRDDSRGAGNSPGYLDIFVRQWYPVQVSSVQYGLGPDGPRHKVTGALIAGPERLSLDV
jgi:hypothetical protein